MGMGNAAFHEMAGFYVEVDTLTCTAVVCSFERAGAWIFALHALREMLDSNVGCDASTFNSAISACEHSGDCVHAVQLLHEMVDGGGILQGQNVFGSSQFSWGRQDIGAGSAAFA
mmetsp:Transcript_100950/g.325256  ORF Transcript_100950/g.325256 Transcript_100950/m.325256 type:complete len:115 (+) Transcript_100950:63-407(+)